VNFELPLFFSESLMVIVKFVIIQTIEYCITEFIEIVKENRSKLRHPTLFLEKKSKLQNLFYKLQQFDLIFFLFSSMKVLVLLDKTFFFCDFSHCIALFIVFSDFHSALVAENKRNPCQKNL
jgi:hypothetical protein